MSLTNVTLLFELSEILDDLEGTFIHVDYEFDKIHLIENGFILGSNFKIKKIHGANQSQSFFTNTQLKNEVSSYLKNRNGTNAIEHFLNAEISPFNSGINLKEHQDIVHDYLQNHKP